MSAQEGQSEFRTHPGKLMAGLGLDVCVRDAIIPIGLWDLYRQG